MKYDGDYNKQDMAVTWQNAKHRARYVNLTNKMIT